MKYPPVVKLTNKERGLPAGDTTLEMIRSLSRRIKTLEEDLERKQVVIDAIIERITGRSL